MAKNQNNMKTLNRWLFYLCVSSSGLLFSFSAASLLHLSQVQAQVTEPQNIQSQRTKIILDAVNAKPDALVEPIDESDIELGTYEGRVVMNKKAKFTYYAHFENGDDVHSKITLIPMSTSRFTATYYQTDAWWDANKEKIEEARRNGTPVPRQDMDEVQAWLEEMKLSTNPDVILIDPKLKNVSRMTLHDYLLDIYLQKFVVNGKVVLFRGAEKDGEHEAWKRGETPRGVRYWTPTATYAWRYGRKNKELMDLLIQGETPLFRFEIPVEDFKAMVQRRWRQLTLGTELTKNAHQIFDRSRYFGDHLFGSSPYTGIGSIGVEFEVRSNRAGAQLMSNYFVRAATIDDLVDDRVQILNSQMERLKKQKPSAFAKDIQAIQNRIQQAEAERKIVRGILNNEERAEARQVLSTFAGEISEIGNIDGFDFRSWAQSKLDQLGNQSCKELFKKSSKAPK